MKYVAAYLLASLGGNASPGVKDIEKILGRSSETALHRTKPLSLTKSRFRSRRTGRGCFVCEERD